MHATTMRFLRKFGNVYCRDRVRAKIPNINAT